MKRTNRNHIDKNSNIEPTSNGIAVLILNWKNIDATVECIKSVEHSRNVETEVFLLDNETNQTAYGELKRRLQNSQIPINFFASYQNLGFAGGVNYLIHEIDLDAFTACFLLNNDAKVKNDTLYTLLHESRRTGAELLGPTFEGTSNEPSSTWPWWLFGVKIPQKFDDENEHRPTLYVDGAGLFVRSSFVKRILDQRGNLMVSDYFLYVEDVELGLRAKQLGTQSFLSRKSTLIHDGSFKTEKRRMITFYYITRNRLFLAKNYLNASLTPLFHIYYLLSRLIIVSIRLLKGEHKYAIAIWEGLRDGYAGKSGKWVKH